MKPRVMVQLLANGSVLSMSNAGEAKLMFDRCIKCIFDFRHFQRSMCLLGGNPVLRARACEFCHSPFSVVLSLRDKLCGKGAMVWIWPWVLWKKGKVEEEHEHNLASLPQAFGL